MVMFKIYDDVKIGLFNYNMSSEFISNAIQSVRDVCSQPTILNNEKTPIISFWNREDNGKRLYDKSEFKEYIKFIKPHIRSYLKELNVAENDAVVTAMWGVHYKPKQFVPRHNHTYDDYRKGSIKKTTDNDVIAILLYLKKPCNSGNLFIETKNNLEFEFNLKAGDIIMFPSSSTWHRTDINESGDEKFIVGIEIVMKWVTDDVLVGKTLEEL